MVDYKINPYEDIVTYLSEQAQKTDLDFSISFVGTDLHITLIEDDENVFGYIVDMTNNPKKKLNRIRYKYLPSTISYRSG